MSQNARERRYAPTEFEVRARGSHTVITGHGAVFGRRSRNLGGFLEIIDPSAFDKTLKDDPDTRALINHDPMHILGRTRSGTLRLSKDSTGLHYEIDVPDRQDARDAVVSIERGDISQSSFGFFMVRGGDEWGETEDGYPLRTLTAVSIHNGDVSPVVYPAYEDADSGLRERALRSLSAARGFDLGQLRAAADADRLRELLAGDPAEHRAPEPSSDLAIARARLNLLG